MRLRACGAVAMLALMTVVLVGCSSGSAAEANTSPPVNAADAAPEADRLDAAGTQACYLFLQWAEVATFLRASENHARVKGIWEGSEFTGTPGAKDSSNVVIRDGVRLMLDSEVAGDTEGTARAAVLVGDECERLS